MTIIRRYEALQGLYGGVGPLQNWALESQY